MIPNTYTNLTPIFVMELSDKYKGPISLISVTHFEMYMIFGKSLYQKKS